MNTQYKGRKRHALSSDESIATVKKGTIKGIKPGITSVTLEANNRSDNIQVTVLEPFIKADNITMRMDILYFYSNQIPIILRWSIPEST